MILDETPYGLCDLWWILYLAFNNKHPVGMWNQVSYYNVPCAFDIETTSTYIGDEKRAFMYIWMLGIDGKCIIGRTWKEFEHAIEYISKYLELSESALLLVYVHNLQYEMQFIKDMFKWDRILALDTRKPIMCRSTKGVEFRCSYRLTGLSLEKVSQNLQTYRVSKMVGDLDYALVRHSKTPLSKKELGYCVNDVLVVMALIQECIDKEGSIANIPYTKTGYV